ncbi:MAG: N-formylglutamate deformylase [Alphaproteobacteria bacterium]
MTDDPMFTSREGTTPLLISIPHGGTELPEAIAATLTPEARALPDTDWHVGRLYEFAAGLGAGLIAARASRYVVDLNRPSDGRSLYPGQATTGLVPTETFDGAPVYRPGPVPALAEIARRVETYWRPYHAALRERVERIRSRFAVAVLWEAHSIRSVVPRLFDGRLPDFNLGTNDGASADPGLVARVQAVAAVSGYSSALNGRFKGGFITRSCGQPATGIQAIQLELAQATYMDEAPPYAYRSDLAARVQAPIRAMLEAVLAWLGETGATRG